MLDGLRIYPARKGVGAVRRPTEAGIVYVRFSVIVYRAVMFTYVF